MHHQQSRSKIGHFLLLKRSQASSVTYQNRFLMWGITSLRSSSKKALSTAKWAAPLTSSASINSEALNFIVSISLILVLKSESATAKSNTTIYLDEESSYEDAGQIETTKSGEPLYCFILYDRIKARSFYTKRKEEHEQWISTLKYLLHKPTLLSKYRILKPLGSGSYGTVY